MGCDNAVFDTESFVLTIVGGKGFQDGEAQDAMFNYPSGIAIDKQGNIIVVDWGNNRIRKIEIKK